MENIVAIGAAGAAGTLFRYWISTAIDTRFGATFPYGTIVVNLVGCFVIGFLFFALGGQSGAHPTLRNAVFVGFLGGFTTFSSFEMQTFSLVESGRLTLAASNIVVSNVGGLACVWGGAILSRLT